MYIDIYINIYIGRHFAYAWWQKGDTINIKYIWQIGDQAKGRPSPICRSPIRRYTIYIY